MIKSLAYKRWWTLILFSLTLTALSVLLLIVWTFSEKNVRFQVATINQQIFTYAPTVIMILLVAVWRQIDYDCKASAPWIELSNLRVTASKSMLLDYISTFQAISFYASVKNNHFTVTITVLGFVLLKVATIASTGLLVLAPQLMTSNGQINLKTRFDGTRYDSNTSAGLLYDQSIVYTAYGLMSNGLQYSFGISSDHAYETFSLIDIPSTNSTFTVVPNAVFPNFLCKPVQIEIDFAPANTTDQNPEHKIQLVLPNCKATPGSIYALNPGKFVCPSRQLSGTSYSVQCPDIFNSTQNVTQKLLTVTDIRYQQTLNESEPTELSSTITALTFSTTIVNMTSILCQPVYYSGKAKAAGQVQTFPTAVESEQLGQAAEKLDNLTDDDLSELVDSALLASAEIFGRNVDNTYASEYPNVMFKLMADQLNGSYTSLFDEYVMIRSANTVFQHLAVQVVDKYLRREDESVLPVTFSYIHEVVQITELSVWLMVGIFLGIVALSIMLFCVSRKSKVTWYPQSLHEQAHLTVKSSTLWPLLDATEGISQSALVKYLSSYKFDAHLGASHDSPIITAIPLKEGERENSADPKPNRLGYWWKPLTASHWFVGLAFVYAIVTIVVLELLQTYSNQHYGITYVTTDNRLWETTITHYAPALVILLLATMFNCIDFNTVLLDPYNRLKSSINNKTPGQRQKQPTLGHFQLVTFWYAILRGRFGIVGSTSAAFIGGLLTIVVSGLYTLETISLSQSSLLNASNVIIADWTNSVLDDGGAAILLSLVENLNSSYPSGTYEELAIPNFDISINNSTSNAGDPLEVRSSLIGYRAKLDCESADVGDYQVRIESSPFLQSVLINVTYPLLDNCLLGGPGGNSSQLQFIKSLNFPLDANDTYLAKMLDLHVGPYDDILGDSQGETVPAGNPDNPPGCPSLAFIYGYVSPENLAPNTSSSPNPCN